MPTELDPIPISSDTDYEEVEESTRDKREIDNVDHETSVRSDDKMDNVEINPRDEEINNDEISARDVSYISKYVKAFLK